MYRYKHACTLACEGAATPDYMYTANNGMDNIVEATFNKLVGVGVLF